MKRIISLLLALVLCFGAIPFFGIEASAATSSAVANAVSNRLPLVTYAMPLSGASKVYSFTNDTFSDKTTSYYIDTFKDQIVITQISTDGKAVLVSYPSSSSSTGYRSRWFATDDILGLAAVDIRPYTCSSSNTTYRMSSVSAVTSYGSISKNDSCVMLGNHTVGGTTYYPTIYPISSGTYNNVSGVRNKLALGRYAPARVQPIPNGKYIIVSSLNNNMVLDVSNGSKDNGANIQLWTRNGSGAQIFTATYNNGGWYTIVNSQSGKALDVVNGEAKCGQNVQQYQANGTNAQKWYLEDAGGGYFYIRSALGYYLDANGGVANNGTNIQIWTGNKSNAQKFKFESIPVNNFWQWPMEKNSNGYRVTQSFNNYSSSMASKGRPYHAGIDMVCTDKVIRAAANGTVIYRGYSSGNGNHIVIKHTFNGKTIYSLYSHLADFTGCPNVNSSVTKGTRIGTMGNTGNSTGAHLHFAIYTGGSTDPLGYVNASGANSIYYKDKGITYYNPAYVVEKNALP